jgi:hypothetical protein
LSDGEPSPPAPAGGSNAPLSRREQMLHYLLKHPEYDEPQINGELTFFIGQHRSTGKSVVTARFNAHPEVFP